jgi:hypothetical protein
MPSMFPCNQRQGAYTLSSYKWYTSTSKYWVHPTFNRSSEVYGSFCSQGTWLEPLQIHIICRMTQAVACYIAELLGPLYLKQVQEFRFQTYGTVFSVLLHAIYWLLLSMLTAFKIMYIKILHICTTTVQRNVYILTVWVSYTTSAVYKSD